MKPIKLHTITEQKYGRSSKQDKIDISIFKPKNCKFPTKKSVIQDIAKKLKKPISEIKKNCNSQIEIIFEKRMNDFLIWKLLSDITWKLQNFLFVKNPHPNILNETPLRHDSLPSTWDKLTNWDSKINTFTISLSHKLRYEFEIFKNKEYLKDIKTELNKKQPRYKKKIYEDALLNMYDFLDIEKKQFSFDVALKDMEKYKYSEKNISKFLTKKTDEGKLEIAEIEKQLVKLGKIKIKVVNNKGNEIKNVFVKYVLDKTKFKQSLIQEEQY